MERGSISKLANRPDSDGISPRQPLGWDNLFLTGCPGTQSFGAKCSFGRILAYSHGVFDALWPAHLPGGSWIAPGAGDNDGRALRVGFIRGQLWSCFHLVVTNPGKRSWRPIHARSF